MRTFVLAIGLCGCASDRPPAPAEPPTSESDGDPSIPETTDSATSSTATTGDTGTSPTSARRYTKLSAGEELTCALFDDGEIACAGSTRWNVPVAPPGPFVDVVASWDTACGVRDTGEIVCWGCDWLPDLCGAPSGARWKAIDAAHDFFCAQDLDDGVACWSNNGPLVPPYGPDLDTPYSSYAVGVTGFVGIRADTGRAEGLGEGQAPAGVLTDLATGRSAACGIRADNGAASCVAYRGPPLPDGMATVDSYDSDFCWLDGAGLASCARRPPEAARDGFDPATEVFVSLTTGHDHACAVTPDGRGFCWPRDGRPETSGILEVP